MGTREEGRMEDEEEGEGRREVGRREDEGEGGGKEGRRVRRRSRYE